MKKTVLFASLIMLLIAVSAVSAAPRYEMVRQGSTGEGVQRVQLRLRELDYLHFKPTGTFRGMTEKATVAFQRLQIADDGSWVAADGEAGEQTQSILFSTRARRAAIPSNVEIPIGPALRGNPTVKGKLITWENVKVKLKVNSSYKVFDFNTGKSFRIIYTGGKNHAEIECATPNDTAVFLEIFGGKYNFSKRAVVVQLDTDTLVAASLFGSPHGTSSVNQNDMEGHTCLFFDGSRSDVGNVTDVEHQKQIYVAAGM